MSSAGKDISPLAGEAGVPPEALANSRAGELADAIAKDPGNYADHLQMLTDLKLVLAREYADIFYENKYESRRPSTEFLWNLAALLPDFNTDCLYQKRASFISTCAAVFLGWILGGFLGTFLGFLGLGGEIWRPLAILLLLWIGEYLGANPRARNILLTVLGLGGLLRFASAVTGGIIRFTTFGAWRNAIFGGARLPNIFKCAWLFFGSLLVFVFLAKKISGLDVAAFRSSLTTQIMQRLALMGFVFEEMDKQDSLLAQCQKELAEDSKSPACPRTNCELALGLLSLLETLDEPTRRYLSEKLAAVGYVPKNEDADDLIWNDEIHDPLYDTIGLINNGDHFKVLRKPFQSGNKLVKGHAQRLDK